MLLLLVLLCSNKVAFKKKKKNSKNLMKLLIGVDILRRKIVKDLWLVRKRSRLKDLFIRFRVQTLVILVKLTFQCFLKSHASISRSYMLVYF